MKSNPIVWVALIFIAVSVSQCEQPSPAKWPPTTCDAACVNARVLCGPETLKPSGATCEKVCSAALENGLDFSTGCLAHASTCNEIRTCSRL